MLKTLKVSTRDLEIGMFVSGLDRSWLGTPFVTQGFLLESQEQIERLQALCEWVYVDSRRSRRAGLTVRRDSVQRPERPQRPESLRERQRIPIERIFQGRPIRPYRDRSAWEEEHPRARLALDSLRGDIDDIFHRVDEGEKLDVIKLRRSVDPIVDSISRNPDACLWLARLKQHDEYTYQHSLGAAIWSVSLGRQLGLPRQDLRSLAMGCMLMDVGKLRVDPLLLRAERQLDTDEEIQVAAHVAHGLDILRECGVINQDVIDIVSHHHERHDGTGYPRGLAGDGIPPFARIAAIVDTYDAITSERHYAPAMSPSDAIKVLYQSRDSEFQAELVESFIQAVGLYPAGTLVELSSGEVGVVVAEYRTRRLRPKVMVLLDPDKQRLPESRIVDLYQQDQSGEGDALSIKCSLEPNAYGIDVSGIPVHGSILPP